jgi:D-amino peptidase
MKVFISADLEGISGVVHGDELTQGTASWERARRWMTSDVVAAAEGAFAAGADEVLVVDGHAGMRNLIYDDLPAGVIAHRGPAAGRVMCQVEGLDDSFDCVLLVGYHSMAGTDGLLSHTWHGGVVAQFRLNGRPIGESGITAAVAGHHGVPVVLVTGDQFVAEEASQLVPGIHTVSVKHTTGRQNARCLPLDTTTAMIRSAAETAVRDRAAVAPLATAIPTVIEIDTLSHRQADRIDRFVNVERVATRTVRITAPDVPTAFQQAWLTVEVADFEAGAWNQ